MFGVLIGTYIVFTISGFFEAILYENIPTIIKYISYLKPNFKKYDKDIDGIPSN